MFRSIFAHIFLLLQLIAFWPVWRWYLSRITDSSDGSSGLVALATALALIAGSKPKLEIDRASFWLPSIITICYVVSYHYLSPLPRAAIAVTAVAATLSSRYLRALFHLGIYGLLFLSLPLHSSLQFYLGYPLRAVVAAMAAPVLQLSGLPVLAEGAGLNWNGKMVLIDAPCSGIRMLRAGLFLTFTLAGYLKFASRKTALAAIIAVIALIFGNLFRSIALFYLESGILSFPGWVHEAVGVVTFLLTIACITWLMMSKKLKVLSPES